MIESRLHHFSTQHPERITCDLCPHHCQIDRNKTGRCSTRKNMDGHLYAVNYGKLVAARPDPIEKKPLYHFYPGHKTYSISSAGCNFKCLNCQNNAISQQKANRLTSAVMQPAEIIHSAQASNCESISYTYTEPTTLFEYVCDVSKLALKHNLKNTMVSNGYMSDQCIEHLAPLIQAINVDIKSMSTRFYKECCGGTLKPVLNTIRKFHEHGVHVELTTLLIPGLNDSSQELSQLAAFIHDLDPEIPWHLNRFHPAFKLQHLPPTPTDTLFKALNIATEHGLRHVYVGNAPEIETHTHCSQCHAILIKRTGFSTTEINLDHGTCPQCGFSLFGSFL